ncbi:unnamed protein product, partial [Lymnaea stagnalis]
MLEVSDVMFMIQDAEDASYDNTSLFLEDEDVMIAHYVMVVVCTIYVPIILVSNFIVFWGIFLYPGFQNPNNYLLLSLSIADFLTGCFCLPMYILSYLPFTYKFVFTNKYVCLTWFASIEIGPGGSLANLFFITIDRYIAVLWPLRYPQIVTKPRTIKAVICMWCFISLLAFSPMLFDWNKYDPTLLPLTARCNFHKTLPVWYVVIATFGTVLTTLLICSVLNAQIIYVSRRQVNSFRKRISSFSREQIRNFQNRMNSVKITSYLMLLFIVLLLPYMVLAPFKYYRKFSQKNIEIIRVTTLLLTFTNSIVNAPIYAMFRREYKEVFKVLL